MACERCATRQSSLAAEADADIAPCRHDAAEPTSRRNVGPPPWRLVLTLVTVLSVVGAAVAGLGLSGRPSLADDDELAHDPQRAGLGRLSPPGYGSRAFGLSPTPTPAVPIDLSTAEKVAATRIARLRDLRSYNDTIHMEGFGAPLAGFFKFYADQTKSTPPGPTQNFAVDIAGSWVLPDRSKGSTKVGSSVATYAEIGNDQWIIRNGGAVEHNTFIHTVRDYNYAGTLWDSANTNFILAINAADLRCATARETVNKESTRRCAFIEPTRQNLLDAFASVVQNLAWDDIETYTGTVDMWLRASDFAPVRVNLAVAGKDKSGRDYKFSFSMDITDINSSAIKIEPPSASPPPPRAATPSPTAQGPAPSRDGVGLLSDLDSYRWTVQIEGSGPAVNEFFTDWAENVIGAAAPSRTRPVLLEVSGAFVAPNRGTLTAAMGSSTTTSVTIKTTRWWLEGGIVTDQVDLSGKDLSAGYYSYIASLWDEGFAPVIDSYLTTKCAASVETVNKVKAQKCSMTDAKWDDIADLFYTLTLLDPEEAVDTFSKSSSLDYWLSVEEGLPIRLVTVVFGKDPDGNEFKLNATFDVTDINSSAITINPP